MEATKLEDIEYPIIQVEEPEYCKLKVHYVADPELVESKVEEAIAALRGMKIAGFRPGKAPDSAIKTKLKPQIDQYIAREMATHAIDDIVFETDIKPIGRPSYTNIIVRKNKFECDIELYKKPEFELKEYKFDIPKPVQEQDEEALAEKSLMNLRIRVGEIEPYEEDDFLEVGDQVTISYEGTIDGEGFGNPEGTKTTGYSPASKVEGEMIQVGVGRWTGFDDYIIGMKADETREFDFVFEDGPEEIVGKTAKFSVSVHMGTKRKPHDINDEFIKKMGVESHEELLEKLKTISRDSLKRHFQESVRSQVGIKLVEAHEFEVPKFMAEAEAKSIAGQSGIDFDKMLSDEEKESFIKQASTNISLTMILDSIRDAEPDSVLNDGEAQGHLVKHLQAQGQDPQALFKNQQAAPYLGQLLSSIKDEFTLQWVSDQANIIE